MSMVDVALWLGIIAGILTSLGIIWHKFIKPLYKGSKKIAKMYDIVEQLPSWQLTVNESLKELHPDHGFSMKDVVDASAADIVVVKRMIHEHIENNAIHNIGDN